MHKIQFGVRVPNSGPLSSIENIVKSAKQAEELGFDSLWVHDHVVWSSEMHKHHISSGAAEALSDTQDANFFEATTMLQLEPAMSPVWQQGGDACPLLIGELVAAHGRTRLRGRPVCSWGFLMIVVLRLAAKHRLVHV